MPICCRLVSVADSEEGCLSSSTLYPEERSARAKRASMVPAEKMLGREKGRGKGGGPRVLWKVLERNRVERLMGRGSRVFVPLALRDGERSHTLEAPLFLTKLGYLPYDNWYLSNSASPADDLT
jgi:hypothetical protein